MSQDAKFRAMSNLARDGFGWEDIYVRLAAAGIATTRAECRAFVFPPSPFPKARRPGGASGALSTLKAGGGSTRD